MGHATGDVENSARIRSRHRKEPPGSACHHGEARLRAEQPLEGKVTTRDIALYRVPAVILLNQFKEIYIDAELDLVDTSQYFPRIYRRDFTVGLNLQTSGPDPVLQQFYGCGSTQNWDGYCSREIDQMIEQQSREADMERRHQLVWAIERKPAEDGVRPIIFYTKAVTCWRHYVKNLTLMVNSIFSGNRREDICWINKPADRPHDRDYLARCWYRIFDLVLDDVPRKPAAVAYPARNPTDLGLAAVCQCFV